MLKGFIIGFFCFILFLFFHFIIFHNFKIKYRFMVLLRIFLCLLPIYVFLYIVSPADIGVSGFFNFLLGFLVYLSLFFGYCQFYFIVDRSISVRMMIELEKSKDKKLTFEQIKEVYNPDYIFLRRLEHMIDSRHIVKDGNFYKNLRKGKILAKLFGFLKDYLKIGIGG